SVPYTTLFRSGRIVQDPGKPLNHFGREGVLHPMGQRVDPVPRDLQHVGQEPFGQPMTSDDVQSGGLTGLGKGHPRVLLVPDQTLLGQPLEHVGRGSSRDVEPAGDLAGGRRAVLERGPVNGGEIVLHGAAERHGTPSPCTVHLTTASLLRPAPAARGCSPTGRVLYWSRTCHGPGFAGL